jgi:GNAT superfamily N-acetyltransferase
MTSKKDALRLGVAIPDTAGRPIIYRFVSEKDDAEAITIMLHEAYAPLKAAGMHFLASRQTPEVTKMRMAKGETVVAVDEGAIVGIITLAEAGATKGSPLYDRADVASIGQYGVRPSHQGRGIGSTLLRLVEERAAEKGVAKTALDTSEHAADLIAFYQKCGYRFVEHVQWRETNYRSVIMEKTLHAGAGPKA